jgi:hypothetical protein
MYALPISATVALLLAARAAAGAPGGRPIVAVFDMQAQGAPVSAPTLAALTDLLAASLAATGTYRTIPRSQIKDRLTKLKLESYRECYDQACQVELGRELAANKSLASRVVYLDGQCILTLELYDLESSTTDFAHTARGGCSEGALFSALTDSLKVLVSRAPGPQAPAAVPARPDPRKVSVRIDSTPSPAEVLLDGLRRGATPLRLDLEKGRGYRLALHREDYADANRDFVAEENLRLAVPLALSPEGRRALATTSEWFGLGFGPGYLNGTGTGLAVDMRVGTLKWYRFFWTLFDVNPVMVFGASGQTGPNGVFNLGTRAGFPLYLGRRGQHQLLFGLGAYVALASHDPPAGSKDPGETRTYFSISPSVDYTYNALDGAVPVGLGLRAHFPVARDYGPGAYPGQVFATLNVGLSLLRLFATSGGPAESPRRRTTQDPP